MSRMPAPDMTLSGATFEAGSQYPPAGMSLSVRHAYRRRPAPQYCLRKPRGASKYATQSINDIARNDVYFHVESGKGFAAFSESLNWTLS
mmetsp:Transcript_11835/g.34166  ORF Transcript_11835/g.34166 Transcript_11835/m.34166 type:complete len:90 (+) Transcript_11835:954-1223(+)